MTRADDNDRRTELDAFLNGKREVKLCLHCENEITYDPQALEWVDAVGVGCAGRGEWGEMLPHEPELDAAERIHDHEVPVTPPGPDDSHADARALLAEMDGVRPR